MLIALTMRLGELGSSGVENKYRDPEITKVCESTDRLCTEKRMDESLCGQWQKYVLVLCRPREGAPWLAGEEGADRFLCSLHPSRLLYLRDVLILSSVSFGEKDMHDMMGGSNSRYPPLAIYPSERIPQPTP